MQLEIGAGFDPDRRCPHRQGQQVDAVKGHRFPTHDEKERDAAQEDQHGGHHVDAKETHGPVKHSQLVLQIAIPPVLMAQARPAESPVVGQPHGPAADD